MTIPQARAILERVAGEYGYTTEQLVSPGRRSTLAKAKRVATQQISEGTGMSSEEIAEVMGCDATTIRHRLRRCRTIEQEKTQ